MPPSETASSSPRVRGAGLILSTFFTVALAACERGGGATPASPDSSTVTPSIEGRVATRAGQVVAEAIVSIGSGLEARTYTPPVTHVLLDQRGKAFLPHVLPVLLGTTVDAVNNDTVAHNIYSRSEAKAFDLGVYRSPEVKPILFDKLGRVDLGCAIHVSMHAIVLVLPHPYFATTDARGHFELARVPDGKYSVHVWHECYAESAVEDVPVHAGKATSISLVVGPK